MGVVNAKQFSRSFVNKIIESKKLGMKSGKIIALGLLALLPIAMKAQEAQEIEKLNARIDSLSQETTTLD